MKGIASIARAAVVLSIVVSGISNANVIPPTQNPNGPDYYLLWIASDKPLDRDMVRGVYRECRYYRNSGGSTKTYLKNGSLTEVTMNCTALSISTGPYFDASTADWAADLRLRSRYQIRGTESLNVLTSSTNVSVVGGTVAIDESIRVDYDYNYTTYQGVTWSRLVFTIPPAPPANDSPITFLFDWNLRATTALDFVQASSSSFDANLSGTYTPNVGVEVTADFSSSLHKVTNSKKMRLWVFGNPGWVTTGCMWMRDIGLSVREIGFGGDFVTDSLYQFQRQVIEQNVTCVHDFKAWGKGTGQYQGTIRGNFSFHKEDTLSCTSSQASFLANIDWQATPATVLDGGDNGSTTPLPVGQHFRHYFRIDRTMQRVKMQDYFTSMGNWNLSVTSAEGNANFPYFDIGNKYQGTYNPYYRDIALSW